MKKFPVNTIESGHYFTKPVYLDEKFILLSPETPMTPELVERLKQWGYHTILSEGEPVETPMAASADGNETISLSVDQDVKESALFREAEDFYRELVGFVERGVHELRNKKRDTRAPDWRHDQANDRYGSQPPPLHPETLRDEDR